MINKNTYIKTQCQLMLNNIYIFEQGIKLAATKDDGKIDKTEQKIINEIQKEIDRLKQKLNEYK